MPQQTTSYRISPEQWELFRKAQRLTDYPSALAFYQTATQPYRSAFGRRLRNVASQYGGGVALGEERRGLAELEAQQASAVTQAIPQNIALAGSLAPPPTVTTKTKSSILPNILSAGAGAVTGFMTGGPLGAVAGGLAGAGGGAGAGLEAAGMISSMKGPMDIFSSVAKYLSIPGEAMPDFISAIISGNFEEWLRKWQAQQGITGGMATERDF